MPHQYGLSTRTGTEAVSCLLRAATETCPRATIGAFDHVSRGAMLGALLARRELHSLLPFVRQFYSSPSVYTVYTWCDDDGCPHEVIQGEGGEQGDPLMPAFYALAQHDALCDLQGQLRDGEAVFAFLDDVYIVALPEKTRALYDALSNALWDRARIRLHERKTRIWNAAGEEPPAVADLGGDAREPVWVGDWSLPPERQGLTVLGSPLGHDAFVAHHLQSKRAEHDRLLQRIPHLDDLQAAWLLLQPCTAPRANYLLRILPPHLTAAYATTHDSAIAQCLANLLELEGSLTPCTVRAAQLPQRFGGLGLRCASSDRHAAHWASWCDTLPVVQARAPAAAERLLRALRGEGVLPCATAAILGRSRAGSDSLPMLATSARTRCTFLTLHLLLERCCCPKLGLSPPVPLMSHPRGMTLPYPAPCFVFSCCAACAFPSRSRRADAAVAGSSTLLVITALPVPPLGSCPPGPCR